MFVDVKHSVEESYVVYFLWGEEFSNYNETRAPKCVTLLSRAEEENSLGGRRRERGVRKECDETKDSSITSRRLENWRKGGEF